MENNENEHVIFRKFHGK